jgi:hypothetical protein
MSYRWLTLLLQPAPCTRRPVSKKTKPSKYEGLHPDFSRGTKAPVKATSAIFKLGTKIKDADSDSDDSGNAEPLNNDGYEADADERAALAKADSAQPFHYYGGGSVIKTNNVS